MNLTKAVLKVNNQKYDILRFSHAFQRDVDQKGRPCSHIYGGEIFAQVESTEDSELFRLMTSKDKPKVTGSIEVLSGDDEVCIKRIEFEDAYIYQFIEEMQRAGCLNMTTNIAISPMRLDINNKMLRLDRSDEYATGWQEYEEEVVKNIKIENISQEFEDNYDEQVQVFNNWDMPIPHYLYYIELDGKMIASGRTDEQGLTKRFGNTDFAQNYIIYWGEEALAKIENQ
jgi:hypothetical protein